MKKIKIPSFLQKKGRQFYRSVMREFVIESSHDVERLIMAAHELDVQEAALESIKTHGYYVTNRYGKLVEHPAVKTLRDSRTLFLRIIRELNLDVEPPQETRPPRLY